MKQLTLEQFEDKTGLLPGLVAEMVCCKRGLPEPEGFAEYVERRTLRHYNAIASFRRNLNGGRGRETLSAFVSHWLDSWLKCKADNRPIVGEEVSQ